MKVLIADDHALFRDALGKLIENLDASATIIQAANFAQTLKILGHESAFDMVVIDPDMQDMPSWDQGWTKLPKPPAIRGWSSFPPPKIRATSAARWKKAPAVTSANAPKAKF